MENTETVVSTADQITAALGDVTTAMAEHINIGTIGIIVAAVLGGSIGLYVTWFAIRKLMGAIKGALKGKLKV